MALALKVSKVETIAGNFFVEPHTVDNSEYIAKEITMLHSPTKPEEVIVDIPTGTSQVYGIDFTVTGNILSWDGFGMETIIDENDRIRITYIL